MWVLGIEPEYSARTYMNLLFIYDIGKMWIFYFIICYWVPRVLRIIYVPRLLWDTHLQGSFLAPFAWEEQMFLTLRKWCLLTFLFHSWCLLKSQRLSLPAGCMSSSYVQVLSVFSLSASTVDVVKVAFSYTPAQLLKDDPTRLSWELLSAMC